MEFKWSSNKDKIIKYFQDERKKFADPTPVKIINAVPYIATLEYGGVRVYNRKKANKLQGVFRNPKGGMTTREPFRTIVFMPPHAMVRRSRRVIRNEAIRLCKSHRPTGTAEMKQMLISMGIVGLRQIKAYTPVDEDIARQGWILKL